MHGRKHGTGNHARTRGENALQKGENPGGHYREARHLQVATALTDATGTQGITAASLVAGGRGAGTQTDLKRSWVARSGFGGTEECRMPSEVPGKRFKWRRREAARWRPLETQTGLLLV